MWEAMATELLLMDMVCSEVNVASLRHLNTYIIVQLSCKQARHSIGEIMQACFTMPAIRAKFVSLALLSFWHDHLKGIFEVNLNLKQSSQP